jgi:hypothetical protein
MRPDRTSNSDNNDNNEDDHDHDNKNDDDNNKKQHIPLSGMPFLQQELKTAFNYLLRIRQIHTS